MPSLGKMSTHRATLIQTIEEFIGCIDVELDKIISNRHYAWRGNNREIIKWIIEEELELIHGLFTVGHIHNHTEYAYLHSRLSCTLPVNLSVLVKHYIKAPRIYDDNNLITVEIKGLDLYIRYYTYPPMFPSI